MATTAFTLETTINGVEISADAFSKLLTDLPALIGLVVADISRQTQLIILMGNYCSGSFRLRFRSSFLRQFKQSN